MPGIPLFSPGAIASSSSGAYRGVTSNDTATTSDDVLYLSGASFNETLYTAVGNNGRTLTIVHNGTSVTNVYTVNTTGGQTIGGSSSLFLRLNGTRLKVVSDGANWQVLSFEAPQIDCEVHVDSGNGFGSTNTKIRRFTNSRKDTGGTIISYADSATNGMSVTVHMPGLYEIQYADSRAATAQFFGISVNTSALATSIAALTYAQGYRAISNAPAGNRNTMCVATINLAAGDIIRAHTDGLLDDTTDTCFFRVVLIRPLLGT